MKYEKRVSFLNVFLNIILVILALPLVFILYVPFMEGININNVFSHLLIRLVYVSGYIIIILTLKRILRFIRNKDPFNPKNVVYFTRIGYYILAVAVINGIISYPMPNNSGIEIMATSYGSLKPTFFLHLVLSLLSFVISDVFKMAMEIKDENDLTV